MKDADLTPVYAQIDAIIATNEAKRAENRKWIAEHMPEVGILFDALHQAGMGPVMKRLERFV